MTVSEGNGDSLIAQIEAYRSGLNAYETDIERLRALIAGEEISADDWLSLSPSYGDDLGGAAYVDCFYRGVCLRLRYTHDVRWHCVANEDGGIAEADYGGLRALLVHEFAIRLPSDRSSGKERASE